MSCARASASTRRPRSSPKSARDSASAPNASARSKSAHSRSSAAPHKGLVRRRRAPISRSRTKQTETPSATRCPARQVAQPFFTLDARKTRKRTSGSEGGPASLRPSRSSLRPAPCPGDPGLHRSAARPRRANLRRPLDLGADGVDGRRHSLAGRERRDSNLRRTPHGDSRVAWLVHPEHRAVSAAASSSLRDRYVLSTLTMTRATRAPSGLAKTKLRYPRRSPSCP
jgi:hypothetical protein